ncbi:MAG: hypothetical protein CSA81_09105 [Acidobacteria bacterium]|nr:MAG: hypothetical protein CSA81_09105 [Acidobacteriota bacterium]
MAATKKRTTKKRKTRKKKTRSLGRKLFLFLLTLAILAAAGVAIYKYKNLLLTPHKKESPNQLVAIESILLAADVQLGSDLETFSLKNETEHWKAHVTRKQKKCIIKALKHLAESQNVEVNIGKEKIVKSQLMQLITLSQNEQPYMKLILSLKKQKKAKKPKVIRKPKPAKAQSPDPVEEPPASTYWESYDGPRVAIIIDDVGMKPYNALSDLTGIHIPITFAILPFQRYTKTCANELHKNHYEVMLHMPMEPTNFPVANPGAGAIFSSFTPLKAQETLSEAIRQVPHVTGVNNHMGSRITASKKLMPSLVQTIKEKNLFFIDSRTHASTIAYQTAKAQGIRCAERDVFLDAIMSYDFTVKQIAKTVSTAKKQGFAVAIGHPYPSTMAAIKDKLPALKAQGISFVFASDIVK